MHFPPMRRMEIARHLSEPLREKFDLPPTTNPDLLLCGLYQRTFITDWDDETSTRMGSPFERTGSPFVAPADSDPPTRSAAPTENPQDHSQPALSTPEDPS
jgi:hypothetical protein